MTKKLASGEFYGTTEKHYNVRGLTLAETAYPRGLAIPPHEHANAFFCLVLEGTVTQTCAQRTWTAEAWDLLVFPAGEMHANRWHESGGRVLHVEFAQQWLTQLPVRPTILDGPANYRCGPLVWLARRLLVEHRRRDVFSPLATEGLILELLAECSRSPESTRPTHPPPWLDRLHEMLRGSFAQPLSLFALAAALGLSSDHLARSFRRWHGCTIGEYVRRLRVEFACDRLSTSEANLAQLALEAGFTDQSHFTKTFKRYVGTTPAAFRRAQRARRSRTKT